jgi:hypothetical protein
MFEMIGLIVAGGAAVGGYIKTRSFVKRRLRYVDGVQRSAIPLLAGAATAIVATPVVALLPLVGVPAALGFGAALGAGVGFGTRAGAEDIRNGTD